MTHTTEHATVTSSARRGVGRARATVVHAVAVAVLAACGGSKALGVVDMPRADATTLVGTWTGRLDGGSEANSYGASNILVVLSADSTFAVTADNPRYCALRDTGWRVAGDQFSATGRDCDGVVVTFLARVAPLRLAGTWTASSGRSGTFTIGKL